MRQSLLTESTRFGSLRYHAYLPKYFKPSLLGSWVSPSYLNYTNTQFKGDVSTIRGRLKHSNLKTDYATTTKQAFKECWLNWRLINTGQVGAQGNIHTNNLPKILLIKFDIDYLSEAGRYRRFLTLMSIVEHLYNEYEELLRVVFIVFDQDKPKSDSLYGKYSLKHRASYFTAKAFSFVGALGLVNRIQRLIK